MAKCAIAITFAASVLAFGCHGAAEPPDTEPPPTDGEPDAEVPGASPVTYEVHLRTEVGGQYLSARDAGGGEVTAAATLAREWELFHLVDVDGDALDDSDLIFLRAYDDVSYLHAEGGGGGALDASGTSMGDFEAFEIVRTAGTGTVYARDHVSLRTRQVGTYVSASDGGGGAVDAAAQDNQAWERFVIDGVPSDPSVPDRQRVIGYLPNWYGSFADWATRVDFSRLTQVNLAFALGDDDGDLELAPGGQIDAFVAAAHAQGVAVFPSLCGGGGDGRIAPHYQPAVVDAFVAKIIAFVEAHDLDGIDVDVEAPGRMGEAYDVFIAKLLAAAGPRGLPVTAAVAPWMQSGMSDDTLRSFDFITVMSYDNAGTWTGPGEHSSYQQAVDAVDFYLARGVAADKIVLGVPFYGYCWGNCGGAARTYSLYRDILARFPDAWMTDWIEADGATLSYNGVATMQAKTELGAQYGGLMIWELGGDVATTEPHSLLVAIDE